MLRIGMSWRKLFRIAVPDVAFFAQRILADPYPSSELGRVRPSMKQFIRSFHMNRRRQLRSVALMSVIFAVLLTIGRDISEDGKVKETPMATTNARTIGSAGSTFVAPLIEHWAHVYDRHTRFM